MGLDLFLPTALLLSSLPFSLSSSSDTIFSGDSLAGDATLVSKSGLYELGLFSPRDSGKHYLSIRYKSLPQRPVVWVANRETPLSDPSTFHLKLDDGILLLTATASTSPVWSSANTRTPNSTVAVLLDTGNLVVRHAAASPNSSDYLWQSFDHLTDTVLPGAKLGYNRTSRRSWSLTAWKSPDDPSPGTYSLEFDMEKTDEFFMLWNGSVKYWSSGKWDGKIFVNYPEMYRLHDYGLPRSDHAGAVYYTYRDNTAGGISAIVLSVTGQLTWQAWLSEQRQWVRLSTPRDPCDVPRRCGPGSACLNSNPDCLCLTGFQPSAPQDWAAGVQIAGCVRTVPFRCSDGEKGEFTNISGVINWPENPTRVTAGDAGSCESACSGDCECTAFAGDAGTCLTWKGELINLKKTTEDSGWGVLHLRQASAGGVGKSKTQSAAPVVGAAVGAALFSLVGVVLWWWWWWRKSKERLRYYESGAPVVYRYADLKRSTKGFSDLLGRGGFGSVYKGVLPDGSAIAVKRLEGIGQGEKQFRAEVAAMAAVQHVNLVRLRGFCCHRGGEQLLVYDFLRNGSLDNHLRPKALRALEWRRRFAIAVGVARGLEYLHDKCRERIIHCDVKPENVLLDEEFRPRVADFGMAKLLGREFSRVLTTVRGTVGYLAPEWISGSAITEKADVYSYGMMLFEVASGRRNAEQDGGGREDLGFFPAWAASAIGQGEVEEGADVDAAEFRRVCRVACWCVQDEEDRRPPMAEVVRMLEGVSERGVPTIPRYLRDLVPTENSLVEKLSFYSLVSSLPPADSVK